MFSLASFIRDISLGVVELIVFRCLLLRMGVWFLFFFKKKLQLKEKVCEGLERKVKELMEG